MKLTAQRFTADFVALAFEPESQAEIYQLAALRQALTNAEADVAVWNTMEGSSGCTVYVRTAAFRPNTESSLQNATVSA